MTFQSFIAESFRSLAEIIDTGSSNVNSQLQIINHPLDSSTFMVPAHREFLQITGCPNTAGQTTWTSRCSKQCN